MFPGNNRVPAYPKKAHRSGQARIYIRGKDFYLGPFGSAKSKAKYARLIAEYYGSDRPVIDSPKGEATVAELVAAFVAWATIRYQKNGKPTSEISLYRAALAPVIDLYGDLDANDFGPLALTVCRDTLAKRHCREKVNQHVGRIRRVWKWGVSKEIVRNGTWQALTSVEGLRASELPNRPKIKPVAIERVNAIEQYVLPPVWAMIQLQLWSAMRPGEVTQMRTCDIHVEDPGLPEVVRKLCWVYRPASHKTEHHERERLILLGPQAQEILRAWMRPEEPEAFLFSPAEAVAYARAKRVAEAKTHKANFKPKRHPKRVPRPFYDTHAYGTAIERGCELAFGMPAELRRIDASLEEGDQEKQRLAARDWRRANCWAPNILRHNAATLIRQRYGVEIARVILGHVHLKTTEVYAEIDLEKAAKAMSQIG